MSRRRLWLFRAAAVLAGLSLLGLFECLCVVCDWGRPELHDDPFVGFEAVRPLFVLGEDQTRYEVPQARQMYFRSESFAALKRPGEFRLFCLGGSTVQGRPFSIETSFTTWLELSLDTADSSHAWEVVNCGGVSYASYRLVPILEEILRHEPDLIIIYTGHNEFLEARTFDHVKSRGAAVNTALGWAARLRTFTLMRQAYFRLQGTPADVPPQGRPVLPTEVEAELDFGGAMDNYHRDEDHRNGVIAQYRFNLRRMIQIARNAGVEVILVNPVSDIRNTPPFKSENRDDLTEQEKQRWQSLRDEAREYFRRDNYNPRQAAALLEQACGIDPLHAGTFYMLAGCYDASGKLEQAREAYMKAKELDVCPLRILQPMNDAVLEIAGHNDVPLVDAQSLFDQHGRDGMVVDGIAGDLLVDHVHPSIGGHQLMADALADELVSLGLVDPVPDWLQRKQRRYAEHLASLDSLYFLKGKQRLDRVLNWARGRCEQIRPER